LLLAGAGADARARLLPWIVSGRVAATVAAPALGAAFARDPAPVRAEQDRTGFILDGEVAQVPNLASAGLVLVPARLGDGMALFALQPEHGHIVSPLRVLDVSRPCATLGLNHLRVDADSRIDAGGLQRGALATTAIWAKLGLAAEQVGAAQGALDVTLAYIRERVQFGRTIASFQAIKHRCARLTVDIAEARSLVYGAAALLAAQGPTPDVTHEVAAARVLATDVQFLAAEESLQLHGGVGFTWEYDPHFFLKRAQADAARLGGRDSELDAIADWLFDDGVAA
jgi:acyl-CoA dehydrogenase